MNIIKHDFFFGVLDDRKETKHIIVHHSGSDTDDTKSIHKWHKDGKNWSGIGYHIAIERDGSVHEGRPADKIGAHTYLSNRDSFGICICGNLDKHPMTKEQEIALKELLEYATNKYPDAMISRHNDHMETTCPGKHFNDKIILEAMAKEKITNINEALKVLQEKGIINTPEYWHKVLDTTKYFDILILNMANTLIK